MKQKQLKKNKILLVEDEESLAIGLEFNLTEEGYIVDWAKDGRQAVQFFEAQVYDLIILDIMLPFLNGFEIAKHIRKKDPQMPILILSARTSNEDKILGFEIGADDYMTKPFHLNELLLRIKGMLKRKNWYAASTQTNPIYKFGKCVVNFENFKCKCGTSEFILTQREAMLLKYLIERRGKIVSRNELLENVWQINPEIETRTVDIFISRLRKYFEPDPENPIYIKGIRAAGYEFTEQK